MAEENKEKPRHLGRGLASLLGPITIDDAEADELLAPPAGEANLPPDKELRESMQELPIEEIVPNPYQSRTEWDQEKLKELAGSIEANGIIQPIVVRRIEQGYELVAGERRYRASKMIGRQTIPAIVRDATDAQMFELALVENIHRANLTPIERARAYEHYLSNFSLTQAQAAERLGEPRSVIANYLRLLELPQEIKEMLSDGTLSMGHAKAILALPTDDLRRKLANRALAGRLSVREVERLVRGYLTETGKARPKAKEKSPHILDLEQRLGSELGTKVSIDTKKDGRKGKIAIEFYSLDEFDSIIERLGISLNEQV